MAPTRPNITCNKNINPAKMKNLPATSFLVSLNLIMLSNPNPDKLEITNYKHQITNKPQIQINEIQNGLFRLLKFGFWNLFVIWDLSFVV